MYYSYYNLVAGVLNQAEKDYVKAVLDNNLNEIKKIDKFYQSTWCDFLAKGYASTVQRRTHELAKAVLLHCKKKLKDNTTVYETDIIIDRVKMRRYIGKDTLKAQKGKTFVFGKYQKMYETMKKLYEKGYFKNDLQN